MEDGDVTVSDEVDDEAAVTSFEGAANQLAVGSMSFHVPSSPPALSPHIHAPCASVACPEGHAPNRRAVSTHFVRSRGSVAACAFPLLRIAAICSAGAGPRKVRSAVLLRRSGRSAKRGIPHTHARARALPTG